MNTSSTAAKPRIQYIDALRGFTMILVVMNHVSRALRGDSGGFNYNEIYVLFRMPLFFFISGFLFYKVRDWNHSTITGTLATKAKVQLIPTVFWGGLYVLLFDIPLGHALIEHSKAGYWFTIALFIFFVVYIFSMSLAKLMTKKAAGRNGAIENLIVVSIALIMVAISFVNRIPSSPVRLPENIYQAVCGPQLWFYIYFVFGTLVRKYFDAFKRLLDSKGFALFIILTVLSYTIYLKFNMEEYILAKSFFRPVLGFLGLVVVFAFFRHYSDGICRGRLGRCLSFVGRRTLDIYLLHYFFIPSGSTLFSSIMAGSPVLDLIVSLAITAVVVSLCLLFSAAVRTSPLLANILFGVKK